MLSWFCFFRGGSALTAEDLDGIAVLFRDVPGLSEGLVLSPAPADTQHPFRDKETPPVLVLQLQFKSIEPLEAAIAADGVVSRLPVGVIDGRVVTEQAMLTRPFPVPHPGLRVVTGARPCSYLVHYPGPAEDLNAWNAHYNAHHPPLMAKFPGVRAIEIYTRIDWVSGLGWAREDAMQRNKLLFDSPAALGAGLCPEVMQEMRADFHRFPAFSGGNMHYALETRFVPVAG